MIEVNQLTPALHENDAVGESIIEIQRKISSWRFKSNIFSLTTDPSIANLSLDIKNFANHDDHDFVNILHFAIPSPLTSLFSSSKGKKILIYHNITPPHFFEGISDELVHITRTGRMEIEGLKTCTDIALADSPYNESELKDYGFKNTGVLPIPINIDRYKSKRVKSIYNLFKDNKKINILFVGRITPNKKIEDVIKIFFCLQNLIGIDSRLFIVGNSKGLENYDMALRNMVKSLNLDEVYFTGKVSQEELITYYCVANFFITMSEHEGFCVPILESYIFDVPVIAYNSTAIPSTLGEGGILINDKKKPLEIAYLIADLIDNKVLKDKIIKKQKEHLKNFSAERIEKILKSVFRNLGIRV
jgi:L-malate glycosyltransferase